MTQFYFFRLDLTGKSCLYEGTTSVVLTSFTPEEGTRHRVLRPRDLNFFWQFFCLKSGSFILIISGIEKKRCRYQV
jgi:hypothetical protein